MPRVKGMPQRWSEHSRARYVVNYTRLQAWLDERKYGRGDVDGFVIFDDDGDMGPLLPYLVQTNPGIGLTDEDVTSAISLLTQNSKKD